MDQGAYPEIGWRITISQGSGADESWAIEKSLAPTLSLQSSAGVWMTSL